MSYSWGYIKENSLSKLNLGEEEANQQGFLSRFPYYANEAMTQICSAIKPKGKTFTFEVLNKDDAWYKLTHEFGVYCDCEICAEEISEEDDEYEVKKTFWERWNSLHFVDEPVVFPEDFISFSDDVAEFKAYSCFEEASDDVLKYSDYNEVICKELGTYKIPYNARWFFFTKDLQNKDVIPAPADICDAIPSYIVSQCFKIDDEAKSSVYRNEFEMFLARIDDTDFKSQRTFKIGGNW